MVFPTILDRRKLCVPTSMYLRNLMAMDTEEMIRAQPMDSVVVIGAATNLAGADHGRGKRRSADRRYSGGADVVGHHRRGVRACTVAALVAKFRAGEIDEAEIDAVTAGSRRRSELHGDGPPAPWPASPSARPVAAMSATIPAPHAERFRSAEASGKVGRDGHGEGTGAKRAADAGGIPKRAGGAAGDRGSTNALSPDPIANRTEHRSISKLFDKLGREVPVLIDLKPSGAHYMEHFHHAGGCRN